MRKTNILTGLITLILLSGIIFATQVDIDNIYSTTTIYVNGTAYITINYVNGTTLLFELDEYVRSNSNQWSQDRVGTTMSDLEKMFAKIYQFIMGEKEHLPDTHETILNTIDTISYINSQDYYETNIENVYNTLITHHNTIQNNIYEVEACKRTFEKLYPEVYCESMREIARDYNLSKVTCKGKICYNGNLDKLQGGKDYCTVGYHPCINRYGYCGIAGKIIINQTHIFIPFSYTGDLNLTQEVSLEINDTRSEINVNTLYTHQLYHGNYKAKIKIISGGYEIYEELKFTINT